MFTCCADDENEVDEDEEADEEEHDPTNPIPDFIDPITLDKVSKPGTS
jgi:hypothetical protein